MTAGQRLRALREQLGLTIRDVECASARLAQKYKNDDYNLPLSRLSDIETKGIVPSIFRLYSLAVIYRQSIEELLSWYGIDLSQAAADLIVAEPRRSHRSMAIIAGTQMQIPVRIDPGFDLRSTTNIGRMVEQWGVVPLAYLQQFANAAYSYGYIGTEDFTMYPILLPGSFVQIDESKNKVIEEMWRSEYERPIYFIETREGYTCCWCVLNGKQLTLQPHPLSPVHPRTMKYQTEAEVVGQVVAVAMRLSDWHPVAPDKGPKALKELN